MDQLPPQLAHLRISKRGFVVPYFVSVRDGQPDFVRMDVRKQQQCIEGHLCGVCGKKLYSDFCYYISGPMGYRNQVSSDPPMHRLCAEYSLEVCPHLRFQKAKRRPGYEEGSNSEFMVDKPEYLLLVKARYKYKLVQLPRGGKVYRYQSVSAEKYIYVDGLLTKENNTP